MSARAFPLLLVVAAGALAACPPVTGGDAREGEGEGDAAEGEGEGDGGEGDGGEGEGEGEGDVGVAPGSPIVSFTDVDSAPAGAYVTLFGRGFGSERATVSADIGAIDVVGWSDRQIELRLPDDAPLGTATLVVHTSAGDAPAVRVRVHAGRTFFVSPSGDDDNAGDEAAPFRTLPRGRDALAAGDVLYLRAGAYVGEDNFSAVLSLYTLPPGTEDAPIAIVGYPGEVATIGDGTLARGISSYTGDDGPPLHYLTIAKLAFRASCTAFELQNGDFGRLVANDISGAHDECQTGTFEAQGTRGWKILGNHIHDNGNTKLEHGVYLGGYGENADFEIAFNRIEEQQGGRGLQLYGHLDGDVIQRVWIHDNVFVDIDRDAIVLGESDGDVLTMRDILIENNVFVRAGRCTGWGVRVDNVTATGVMIRHNTFVDNGAGVRSCDQSGGELGAQILVENAVEVAIEDNLLAARSGELWIDEPLAGVARGASNLYGVLDGSSAGDVPAWDARAVQGPAGFVDEPHGDLHLTAASAAVDAASGASPPADADGVHRPQGAAADIGAFERAP